jgi:hypothetical protein
MKSIMDGFSGREMGYFDFEEEFKKSLMNFLQRMAKENILP